MNKKEFSQLIKEFRFKELFNEMGWDHIDKIESILINDKTYRLEAAAQKRGFVIFVCVSDNNQGIPQYNIRKKIDTAITKLHFEHLIIYIDQAKTSQLWQLIIREHGKPTVVREIKYFTHQMPELLLQKMKGLFFSIDDEDKITIVDVTQSVHKQFTANAEKVTKQFYDKFKKEHNRFIEFIEGIDNLVNKRWYASLMLNRLMFVYFIQKKSFLDNNINYLREKLKDTQIKRGDNKFFHFIRIF